MEITDLEPKALWKNFTELNSVPRPSKKEERVIEFVKSFGEGLGLKTSVDEIGNVIIVKKATPGLEDRVPVVLQSHLDMVHQKNADTDFDFDKEGIHMMLDGDWVKAEGTTLGADNGIGVAAIMGILASDNIPHPDIEALFTIDEETGMTGASGLSRNALHGKILLNLDTEDDMELTIGCAGGIDIMVDGSYKELDRPADQDRARSIKVHGLTGGHSGMDIHLGRGNSNKILNRILASIIDMDGLSLASIDSGGLRNAIPREGQVVITYRSDLEEKINAALRVVVEELKHEFSKTDPNFQLTLTDCELPDRVADPSSASDFSKAIYACQNGIFRMSPDMEGLVQTSNNLARMLVKEGKFNVQCLTRSSVDSEKMELARTIRAAFELMSANVVFSGSYPGWTPVPEAGIVSIMGQLYKKKFGKEALVNACHAGLECGIIGSKYPGMEMISFGPNIRGAHSPDEKVQVSSVQKFWSLLLDTLLLIPSKN